MSENKTPQANSASERLITALLPVVHPMGYEVVHVEVQNHRQKTLRVFIDFAEQPTSPNQEAKSVGIEDCVKVTRALEEPLEAIPELEAIFKGPYELEVSSPGVDRPLRTSRDFGRFAGRETRIHVYRPLTADELGNAPYQARNPKQKNFLGRITGVSTTGDRVELDISPEGSFAGQGSGTKGRKNAKAVVANNDHVTIPLALISKANLEPRFEFDGDATEIDAEN